jgi:putative transposase
LGFKAFDSASATIAGIEVAHMNNNRSPFEVFAKLAA